MQSNKTSLLSILILLILIIGAVFWFKKFYKGNSNSNVVVTNGNINSEKPGEKVSPQFPKEIPLQLSEVTESKDMEYAGGMVVSTITFKTFRSPAEIFSTYKSYMIASNYTISDVDTSAEKGRLFGRNNNSTLAVLISPVDPKDGKISVQLVYTKNK